MKVVEELQKTVVELVANMPENISEEEITLAVQNIIEGQRVPEHVKMKIYSSPQLKKTFICHVEGFNIFTVNGEFVRNNLEIDFTMGSNPRVSSYIPKGEVWLDDRISRNDMLALIFHEVYEAKMMKRGLSYEEAHALATEAERKLRKNF